MTINTNTPCYGYDSERYIMSPEDVAKDLLPYEKENYITECPTHSFLKKEPLIDKRFSISGFINMQAFFLPL